jgi:hypothetical protein
MKILQYSTALLFTVAGLASPAQAAQDWTDTIDWWGWQGRHKIEMCTYGDERDWCDVYGIARDHDSVCPNVHGNFGTIALGMESEGDNVMKIKFFSCAGARDDVGMLCIDTKPDGGFEACGVVSRKPVESFAPVEERPFELAPQPAE